MKGNNDKLQSYFRMATGEAIVKTGFNKCSRDPNNSYVITITSNWSYALHMTILSRMVPKSVYVICSFVSHVFVIASFHCTGCLRYYKRRVQHYSCKWATAFPSSGGSRNWFWGVLLP